MEICGFELAKKLKEKGFPQKYMGGYNMIGPTYIDDGRFYENGCITEVARAYSAPTISQVLKWFREEKKIYIMINFWPAGYNAEIYTEIGKDRNSFCWGRYIDECDYCDSYEQAAIEGIEYVIDILI